ncbi:RNA polymerase sigma-70 factor (ECF subfamily) [Silvibacterium bohemicum]|uniref:RNA polymerase sigma factor n=1 Tax=Silvibacterium bohemicum TaxID=1577686 RepID=A0A841K4T1_9BACT|nr:RNA polymerase sigma factor [Silvibacterium bohemicum]MBB6145274.1 RNA polymerase sigma-70 factor (ECF subfamily) [Silvibacterium bohemicum]
MPFRQPLPNPRPDHIRTDPDNPEPHAGTPEADSGDGTRPLPVRSGPDSEVESTSKSDWDEELDSDLEIDIGNDLGDDPEETETMDAGAQPGDENGVDEDMATIALDRPLDSSLEAPSGLRGAGFETGRSATAAELSAMSDAEIMLRVREGDDSGFEYLIQKYHKPMIHFMFRMVHNQAVAEELAQEVFLRVYRSRQSYRAEAKFTTWLYRIATNLGVNHARDTKYERAAQNVYLDQPDPETGTTPDVADLTASVEQELVKDERMRAIRQHVLALPERQRTAVLMHKYQGLDYKQIGEVLKLSESATKSLLFRAYQTLRERLKEFV